MRCNRKGLPAISPNAVKALKQGEWIQRQKRDMTLAVWKDKQTMRVLYNHISPLVVASLSRWSEAGERISIGCPQAIRDYFYHARSVDVLSQLHYAYRAGRKSMHCWPRLAWWLLDMCIINAFKLWSMARQHPSQLEFREQLMHELVKHLPVDQHPRKHGGHPPPANALATSHSSELTPEAMDCKHCSHRSEQRKRTNYICNACQVHLCLGECFRAYHANV